jgi:hypothetical protein
LLFRQKRRVFFSFLLNSQSNNRILLSSFVIISANLTSNVTLETLSPVSDSCGIKEIDYYSYDDTGMQILVICNMTADQRPCAVRFTDQSGTEIPYLPIFVSNECAPPVAVSLNLYSVVGGDCHGDEFCICAANTTASAVNYWDITVSTLPCGAACVVNSDCQNCTAPCDSASNACGSPISSVIVPVPSPPPVVETFMNADLPVPTTGVPTTSVPLVAAIPSCSGTECK